MESSRRRIEKYKERYVSGKLQFSATWNLQPLLFAVLAQRPFRCKRGQCSIFLPSEKEIGRSKHVNPWEQDAKNFCSMPLHDDIIVKVKLLKLQTNADGILPLEESHSSTPPVLPKINANVNARAKASAASGLLQERPRAWTAFYEADWDFTCEVQPKHDVSLLGMECWLEFETRNKLKNV